MYKKRNNQIKQALLKVYKLKDVSVKGDTGTATGWVNVKLTLDKPKTCTCNFVTKLARWAKIPYEYTYREQYKNEFGEYRAYCPACTALLEQESKIMKSIVYNCGAEFGTFYADDGYNTERMECIEQIDIRA